MLLLVLGFGYKNLTGSNTAIGAINKNLGNMGLGPVNYVVKELPVNGGELVFYIRNFNNGRIDFDIRFVKKTFGGWKITRYGGNMGSPSIAYHPSERAIKDMPILQMYLPKRKGVNLNPIIVGTIADPNMSRIVIKNKSGLERQANIIKVNDTFKIFYQFVSEKEGKSYEILAYDSKGTVIKKMGLDTIPMSSSSTKKVSN